MSYEMAEQDEEFLLPIYINRQSELYINNSLKIATRKIADHTQKLYQEAQTCTTDKCLTQVRVKLSRLKSIKQKVSNDVRLLDNKVKQDYYLCRDLVFENDIRFCRVEVVKKYYQQLIQTINKNGLSML